MNSARSMLGLCARAGFIISGQAAVDDAVKRGKARVVVIDSQMSDASKKAVTDACRFRNVPALIYDSQSLGDAIGKPGRMVVAVTDSKMADRVRQLLASIG